MDANAMFDIQSNMVEGDLKNLQNTINGIIIGAGISEKLNIRLNENITVISSIGRVSIMKVVGIFQSGNMFTSKSHSYMNLQAAQQLMGQGSNFITEIYVNIKDPEKAVQYLNYFENISGYHVEDWKTANESLVAAGKTRTLMLTGISLAILLVATFGIYNILNMTIMEKMNDIAILKATGFSGKHVIRIFVSEALVMGLMGISVGLMLATLLVYLLSRVYVGGDFGYFPIRHEPSVFIAGILIGLLATFGAGYIPARKAAKIDPVKIFRK
jgi:lipoprotein-releasing system permease protein